MYIAEKGAHHWKQEIEQVKVQWKHFRPDEATWEKWIRCGPCILTCVPVEAKQF